MTATPVELRLLGPFEVVIDGRRLDLGPPKQRAVLAVLAIELNQVVSLDRLIEELWRGEPPATATGSLQAYISNLRRILEPDRPPRQPPRLLATQAPGYLIRLAPTAVDGARFEAAAHEGRRLLAAGEPAAARQCLCDGLAEWRGPALADFVFEPFAQVAAARLDELRRVALEDRFQSDLELGDHGRAVPELEAAVAAHPLRERLWELLLVALYRSGRQADALRSYQAARRVLREELGLEPGPRLRRIEADILAQAGSLEWHAPRTVPPPADPPPAEDPAPDPDRQPFVGRLRQLTRIDAAVATAAAGRGGTMWVTGEAGIGKTRLVDEVAARARARGALVAHGGAVEDGATPAYWPWVGVVRELLDTVDPDLLRSSLNGVAAELAQVVPEVKELTGPHEPPAAVDPHTARLRLFEAMTAFLGRLGRDTGVIVMLEDLQWADKPSLQLLGFLAPHLADVPLLVVGTYRPAEVGATHPLTDTLATFSRHQVGDRVGLAGLDEHDVGALVTAITGTSIPAVARAAVHARTEGNPFFVGELARLLQSRNGLGTGVIPQEVPAGVRDVVRLRLARLPEQTTALLSVAAIVGRVFDLRVLELAARLDADRALELVEAALVSGLVVEDPEAVGCFRFTHDLVRAAVVEDLSGLRRARLHARVGEAVEALWGNDGAHAVALAHHFLAASAATGPEKATTWAIRAAEVEASRLAYDEAEGHLSRVLEALGARPAGADRDRLELSVLVALFSLLMLTRGYAAPQTGEVLARAQALCLRLGDSRETVRVVFGQMTFQLVSGNHRTAHHLADQLLRFAEQSGDRAVTVAAHHAAGLTSLHLGELEAARDHFEEGLAASEGLDDPWLAVWFPIRPIVDCATFLAWIVWQLGQRDRAWDLVTGAKERAGQLGHDATTAHALQFVAWIAVLDHDGPAALVFAEEALAFAAEKQFPFYAVTNAVLAGWARAETGEAAAGAAAIRSALAGMAAVGAGICRTFFLALLAEAECRAGRVVEALAALDEAVECVDCQGERFYEPELHRLRGELLVATGAPVGEAVRELERALATARELRTRPFEDRAAESLRRLRQV